MVGDFLDAAYLWIILGLFVAFSCAFMNRRKRK